jgi:DNA repair exonuclease SbcCD ATPase subunit
MRQIDLDGLANTQREELRKTIDALLKEKSALVMAVQGLELESEKLKYTVSELENQVSLYKNDKFHKIAEERETLISNQQPEGIPSAQSSPRKSDTRDLAAVLRDKEAEFHRTIENYEEHHSNLTRATKRYEERIGELENKLMSTEKNWRVKLEAKEMEVIEIKAFTRQEFTDQISMLRKENSALKILNNDLSLKMESLEKNVHHNNNYQNYDWEADLVQEMIAVKANLEPLRQQISELQEMNFYEKEQSVRERTNLQTHVLELQSEVERQSETIKNLEKKILEAHQEKLNLEEKANNLRRLEEENQLLTGKVIVMESREIALKNRSGEELEERILEFESRIELLINNKEGLKEMKDIGIHQLLALKAYIL